MLGIVAFPSISKAQCGCNGLKHQGSIVFFTSRSAFNGTESSQLIQRAFVCQVFIRVRPGKAAEGFKADPETGSLCFKVPETA